MSNVHAHVRWGKAICKEPGDYIGWPSIARKVDGELLVVFSGGRDTHVCPYGKTELVRSQDGGETWSPPETINNTPLDDRNNRLLIQRTPGDRIRIKTDRDSMVFSVGEVWALDVVPHRTGYPSGSSVRFEAELVAARSNSVLWQTQRELRVDEEGGLPVVSGLQVPLPDVEGVYDVRLTLHRTRLRNPFVLAKPTIRRSLQVVVLRAEAPTAPGSVEPWGQVAEFDPAQRRWWERIPRLPQWRLLRGVGLAPLGNKRASIASYNERSLTQLAAGGWQAYPLPITTVGTPHVLEVEYPEDIVQTLGISIVEPNSAGTVAPVGLDSGVDVSRETASRARGLAWHRLVFWPRTKAPYILLTNRRPDTNAMFGRIRVSAGPTQLPPAARDAPSPGLRMPLAHFDRPLFPEIFCASDAVETGLGRALDDWLTFYEGGSRLTEYLKHVGYAGASIAVYCEGSTIYPTKLLDSTPKYDTGVYFSSGQDPLRKDVLEMLLRMFDREGLQLVPALQFTAPLPALELIIQGGASARPGVELVDQQGHHGTDRNGAPRRPLPYYNPLDERVQAAMRDVVGELVQRYGHHKSFVGVSLDLSPDSCVLLPGLDWGYDAGTMQRFWQETSEGTSDQEPPASAEQLRLVTTSRRQAWIDWRARKVFQLHDMLYDELKRSCPDAKLYLAGSDMLEALPVRQAMRPALPRLPTIREVMLEMGMDAKLYEDHPGIVLMRPQRLSPIHNLVNHAVNLEFNESEEVDRLFASGLNRGSLFYHETQALRLTSFDEISPFGRDKTHTWLAPRFSPAGAVNRRRFIRGIATLDAQSFFDGGWTVAMGQEETLRDLLDTYRRLPTARFVSPSDEQIAAQPVIVRTLAQDDQTYIYLVNDSAWPVSVQVQLEVHSGCRLQPLSQRRVPPPLIRGPSGTRWEVSLQPYDLIAGILTAPQAKVTGVRVELPPDVVPMLEARIAEAGARVARLKEPPLRDMLVNPGFEKPPVPLGIAGWIVAKDPQITTYVDAAHPQQGLGSLRLESSGPFAWVRSEPFDAPQTGRLSLQVMLRCKDAQRTPKLRLVVEGQLIGGSYRQWSATVGAGPEPTPLGTEWAPFVFPISDLPIARLENLRIGFDLMGPGTVWIDDIRLFDLSFSPNEQHELRKIIARSHFQLRDKKYADCAHGLNQYWPRFLRQHVTLPDSRLANIPPPPLPATSPREKPKPSVLERVKRLVPRMLRF